MFLLPSLSVKPSKCLTIDCGFLTGHLGRGEAQFAFTEPQGSLKAVRSNQFTATAASGRKPTPRAP